MSKQKAPATQSGNGTYDAMQAHWDAHWGKTRFADEYATNLYPRRQEEFQAICKYLRKDSLVLEAGCAYGHVVKYFQEQGYRIFGLDYAAQGLEIGRTHAPDLKLVQGDIHALPFPDNSLGGYLSFGVLEHFDFGPLPALREAYRVLKPGGIAAITMPLPTRLVREWIPRMRPWLRLEPMRRSRYLRQVFGKQPLASNAPVRSSTFYEQPYSCDQVREFLTSAGFQVVEQMPIYHAFWLYLMGWPFQDGGYYRENALAQSLSEINKKLAPWHTAFFSLAIARKS